MELQIPWDRLYPCRRCDDMVYSYQQPAMLPDEDGTYAVHEEWVHLHRTADGHDPDPRLTTGEDDGQD